MTGLQGGSGHRKSKRNPQGNGTDTSKDRKHCGDPVPSPMKREGTRKVTEKGDTKGNGPKGTSPSGKPDKPVCYHYKRGQCPKESACDHWHAPENAYTRQNPKSVHMEVKCIFKHTGKARDNNKRNVTNYCQTLGGSTSIELCIERLPRIYA